MGERLVSDIAADLRGRAGLSITSQLLVEAADKLDELRAEREQFERLAHGDVWVHRDQIGEILNGDTLKPDGSSRCGGLDGTHTVRNCGTQCTDTIEPVAGEPVFVRCVRDVHNDRKHWSRGREYVWEEVSGELGVARVMAGGIVDPARLPRVGESGCVPQ